MRKMLRFSWVYGPEMRYGPAWTSPLSGAGSAGNNATAHRMTAGARRAARRTSLDEVMTVLLLGWLRSVVVGLPVPAPVWASRCFCQDRRVTRPKYYAGVTNCTAFF